MPIDNSLYSNETTIYRTKISEPKHKLWFIIDKNLVLPEYLVEFEYVMEKQSNKLYEFGEEIGFIKSENDEFITS